MKSAPRGHREQRRAAHVVVRAELAGLEDHLQVRGADGLLHLHDLVVDLRVAAGEERAAVDHHVDLVGAELDGAARVGDLEVGRVLPGREAGRDGGDRDAGARGARSTHVGHEVLVDADRGDARGSFGSHGSGRIAFEQSAATLPGVSEPSSVVRSMQRIASSSAKTFASFLIERFASARGALLERDRVDRADPRQPRLERKLESGGKCRRLGHGLSVDPASRDGSERGQSRLRNRHGLGAGPHG